MIRRLPLISSTVLACLTYVLAVAPPASAALTPSNSVFFFKTGHAMSGTLVKGIFTKKKTYTMNGSWTAAAASRDTLLLYNAATGAVKTGTLRGGVFTAVAKTNVPTGYGIAAASCDSVMLYNASNGGILEGRLTGGKLHVTNQGTLSIGWNTITASCGTILFQKIIGPTDAWGDFTSGVFTQLGNETGQFPFGEIATSTDDSWFDYQLTNPCVGNVCGDWGILTTGHLQDGYTESSNFSTFNHVTGTAGSLLFYRSSTGAASSATLKSGTYHDVGVVNHLGTGWSLIAGGR